MPDLREKRFESDIENWLLHSGGYMPGNQLYYLRDKAVDLSEMIAFISETQHKSQNAGTDEIVDCNADEITNEDGS